MSEFKFPETFKGTYLVVSAIEVEGLCLFWDRERDMKIFKLCDVENTTRETC